MTAYRTAATFSILLVMILTTACANNNNTSEANRNVNISADSTEKSSDHLASIEQTHNNKNSLPPESDWYDPLTDPRAKETPGSRESENQFTNTENRAQPESSPGQGINEFTAAIISLTNDERQKFGLNALKVDDTLNNVAIKKSQDMQQHGYFSHNSPQYGTPFEMMAQFDTSFTTAGENIARDQPSPQAAFQKWMDSPGHRANILNSSFTHIGVGYNANGDYWSQMFIEK